MYKFLNKNNLKQLMVFLLAMATLCFMAFYNRFPFIFNNDTGVYIDSAFQGRVSSARPILYGLFIMFTSLKYSLWLTIFIQSLITAFIIFYYFRIYNNMLRFYPFFLGYVIIISFSMGGSFDVSWLMADIFTPIAILCVGLLLFVDNLKQRDKIIISIVSILSIAMHNSNFYIIMGLMIVMLVGFMFKLIRKFYKQTNLSIRKVVFVISLAVISSVFLSLIHYSVDGKFRGPVSGVIFFMGNLVEMGVVNEYLAENCEQQNYEICQYRDTIPNNFIWDPNSPIYKTGGWEASQGEYKVIVKDILTTPKYFVKVVQKSVLMTLKQFFHFDTGEAVALWDITKDVMRQYYPNDFPNISTAKQNTYQLKFDFVNHMQKLIVGLCLFIYILVFLLKKMTLKYRLFIGFILLALLINAAVCGIFSGVFPRYQSRVIWLLPLPLFLYLQEYYFRFGPNLEIIKKYT